jgi:hypothetical protein
MNRPHPPLFGDENARHDALLYDCYVEPPDAVSQAPILVGRWGTDKTGLLLYRNKDLSDALRAKGDDLEFAWYLDEARLDLYHVFNLSSYCDGNNSLLKRYLESVWRSEVIRVICLILNALYSEYGSPGGTHWDAVRRLSSAEKYKQPLWHMLSFFMGVTYGDKAHDPLHDLRDALIRFSDDLLYRQVQQCLQDIENHPAQPVVAFEPIETPFSVLENDANLAQILVTSLLNVFLRHFYPSARQRIQLQVSVPWHRYSKADMGLPQHLFGQTARIEWSKSPLREFINKRIEYELRRIRRQPSSGGTDAWQIIFGPQIYNERCGKTEDSFAYFLRHSQYRPRDVLRLVRKAIEFQASANRMKGAEDVLLSGEIDDRAIRAAIRKTCKDTAEERELEAKRRFPGFESMIRSMRGMHVPFDIRELKRRFERYNVDPSGKLDINEAVDKLWRGGIIGVELTAHSEGAARALRGAMGQATSPVYRERPNLPQRHYLFEHNTERKVGDFINEFANGGYVSDVEFKIVLHPMMFEYLAARTPSEYPIGA